MMNGGIQIVILALVSFTGIDLRPQQLSFDYDTFGGDVGVVSSTSAFASSSSSIVFNYGGFFESPSAQLTANNGRSNKNQNKNKNQGHAGSNQAHGGKKGGNGNAAALEFPGNPFLHQQIPNHGHPTNRPSPPAHASKPPKKPAKPTVPPTASNKNKRNNGGNKQGNVHAKGQGNKKKRVSQIKYEQYLTSIFPDESLEDVTDFNGRELARPGEFPHMGAIGFRNTVLNRTEYKCGASLISNIYAVTTAHCTEFNGLAPTFVRFGDLNLKAAEEDIDPQTRRIAQIINHPQYNENSLYNDIALIELAKPVIFTEFVRPIRLWHHDDIPFTHAFAMGFGAVQFAGAATNRLTLFNLTLIPNDLCNKELPKEPNLTKGIIDSQMCAIDYKKKGSDTFQGDSGGPLQVSFYGRRRGRLHEYLIGLTSFGVLGLNRYPGVYTRVSSYVDWIEQIVWGSDYY